MENKINVSNNCGGRGCFVYRLPFDSKLDLVYSKVFPKRHDIKKMVSSPYLFLDKVVAKKR